MVGRGHGFFDEFRGELGEALEGESGLGLGPYLVGVEAELDGASDVLANAGKGLFVEAQGSAADFELYCAKAFLGGADGEGLRFGGGGLADDCVNLDWPRGANQEAG